MQRVFDPEKLRATRRSRYPQAVELAGEDEFSPFFWTGAVGEVALAHFVGASSAPQWHAEALLALARSELRRGLTIPSGDESSDVLYNTQRGFVALALADWIASDELQPVTMSTAHDVYLQYFARFYRHKKPTLRAILEALGLACAAERFEAGAAFLATHLPKKRLDPSKARTTAELCASLHASAPPSDQLARRFLRAQLPKQLAGGHYTEGALSFYLAIIAGLPGPATAALGRAPDFISYLKRNATNKGPKGLSALPVNRAVAPQRSAARPERILPSSMEADRETRTLWKQTDDGWALYSGSRTVSGELGQLIEARAGDIVEWSAKRGVPSFEHPQRLRRLRRATLDGWTLARWARCDHELPLEVAFAPYVDAWSEGRRVAVPPRLDKKKEWNDALDVGALTSLRAMSVDVVESDKDRLKRGDGPYPTVPRWFASSRLAGRLEALELHASPHDLASSLELFDVLPNLRELIIWLRAYGLGSTACFWCRRGGVLIQAQGIAVERPLTRASADRRIWEDLLPRVLTPAAAGRLGKADVTTSHLEKGVDPEAVRACVGRHIDVGTVTIAGLLREL